MKSLTVDLNRKTNFLGQKIISPHLSSLSFTTSRAGLLTQSLEVSRQNTDFRADKQQRPFIQFDIHFLVRNCDVSTFQNSSLVPARLAGAKLATKQKKTDVLIFLNRKEKVFSWKQKQYNWNQIKPGLNLSSTQLYCM